MIQPLRHQDPDGIFFWMEIDYTGELDKSQWRKPQPERQSTAIVTQQIQ
jgi:hypothetical protein